MNLNLNNIAWSEKYRPKNVDAVVSDSKQKIKKYLENPESIEINKIYCMDCIDGMKQLEANSVDSIVTDPPYELGFMGKSWDGTGIAFKPEVWKQALRVLKPGGHLLGFGGTRTYHRMACAIEDAGFEIRDQIQWIYSTGFPKSLNIGKAIDKVSKRLNLFTPFARYLKEQRLKKGFVITDVSKHFMSKTGGVTGCVSNWELGYSTPTKTQFIILKQLLDLEDTFDDLINRVEAERKVIGEQHRSAGNDVNIPFSACHTNKNNGWFNITAPSTDQAKKYDGWGTNLKPANEPICVARKPLEEKTVAANVLKYGTGGINIDDCRIGTDENIELGRNNRKECISNSFGRKLLGIDRSGLNQGRFPSNVILDGSEEVTNLFPNSKSTGSDGSKFNNSCFKGLEKDVIKKDGLGFGDDGSASRFFYCAKASKSERNKGLEGFDDVKGGSMEGGNDKRNGLNKPQLKLTKNIHPTIKPVKLIEYLIRLVTPKGGVVLDPFMGSGTTGMAAKAQGFNYIGFDMTKEYCEIAEARIKSVDHQMKLF